MPLSKIDIKSRDQHHFPVRTTLTLDDDVLELATRLATLDLRIAVLAEAKSAAHLALEIIG